MNIFISNNHLENINIEELELRNKYNNHQKLILILRLSKNEENKILNKESDFIKIENEGINIFEGNISEAIVEDIGYDEIIVRIEALNYSSELSKLKRTRLYQDTKITYSNIIKDILRDTKVEYHISKSYSQMTNRILYQYEESDWDFLVRISSYINQVISITNEGVILFGNEALNSALEIK